MVKSTLAGRSDIHTGALSNRLEAFKDGDRGGVI
jgi:hypothetical protein